MNKQMTLIGAFGKYMMYGLCGVCMSSVLYAKDTSSVIADNHMTTDQPVLAMNEFVYNPKTLQWQAINGHGKVVKTGRGSAGSSYCPDVRRACRTPSGTYHVLSKGGAGCRSSRYPLGKGGAPMPYCMYFNKNYAIHGSYEIPHRNASHGCIRVKPQDARWLSNNFMEVGTKVVVKPY